MDNRSSSPSPTSQDGYHPPPSSPSLSSSSTTTSSSCDSCLKASKGQQRKGGCKDRKRTGIGGGHYDNPFANPYRDSPTPGTRRTPGAVSIPGGAVSSPGVGYLFEIEASKTERHLLQQHQQRQRQQEQEDQKEQDQEEHEQEEEEEEEEDQESSCSEASSIVSCPLEDAPPRLPTRTSSMVRCREQQQQQQQLEEEEDEELQSPIREETPIRQEIRATPIRQELRADPPPVTRNSNSSNVNYNNGNNKNNNNNKPTPTIEISPGVFARLRGATETYECIEQDFYMPALCFACAQDLFCIQDASYVLCPLCRVVSPMEGDFLEDHHGGVGLGFTMHDLCRWQTEILAKQKQQRQEQQRYY